MDSAVPQIVTGKEDTMQRGAQPLRHEATRYGAISNTLPSRVTALARTEPKLVLTLENLEIWISPLTSYKLWNI